jgi:hypothetical protein
MPKVGIPCSDIVICPAAYIMIRIGAVFECFKLFQKVSIILCKDIDETLGLVLGHDGRHMEPTDYHFNCIMVLSCLLHLDISLRIFHDAQCPTCNGILMLNLLFVLVQVVPNDLVPKQHEQIIASSSMLSLASLSSSDGGSAFSNTMLSSSLSSPPLPPRTIFHKLESLLMEAERLLLFKKSSNLLRASVVLCNTRKK